MRNNRLKLIALAVVLVAGLACWRGTDGADAFNALLARLGPISVRSLALTESERNLYASANTEVQKYLVCGRTSAGAMVRCWIDTYHQGAPVEGEEVLSLEVPVTNQGLTLILSREGVVEDGHWVRHEWALTAGSTTSRGTTPFHPSTATASGGPSGPLDLSHGEPVVLYAVAYSETAPGPGIGHEGLTSEILKMDHAYVLKVMVVEQ